MHNKPPKRHEFSIGSHKQIMDMPNFSPGSLPFADAAAAAAQFDYGAFLNSESPAAAFQHLSPIQHHQRLSESSGGLTPTSSDNRSSGSGGELTHRGSQQKQRMERRGHTKSRRGCYNCKRRRIKVWRWRQIVAVAGGLKMMSDYGVLTFESRIVPGVAASLRPLRQDRFKVRVSCRAANYTPGMQCST